MGGRGRGEKIASSIVLGGARNQWKIHGGHGDTRVCTGLVRDNMRCAALHALPLMSQVMSQAMRCACVHCLAVASNDAVAAHLANN
jgi:hypothetical protein